MLARAVQLKISLDDTNPSIWRRILILENSSLRTLRSKSILNLNLFMILATGGLITSPLKNLSTLT